MDDDDLQKRLEALKRNAPKSKEEVLQDRFKRMTGWSCTADTREERTESLCTGPKAKTGFPQTRLLTEDEEVESLLAEVKGMVHCERKAEGGMEHGGVSSAAPVDDSISSLQRRLAALKGESSTQPCSSSSAPPSVPREASVGGGNLADSDTDDEDTDSVRDSEVDEVLREVMASVALGDDDTDE
eukprot:Sspe_Gene.112944::Locus_96822_Transcript_1_1_Confidence_1.000_Length_737::g.112944::m.112944